MQSIQLKTDLSAELDVASKAGGEDQQVATEIEIDVAEGDHNPFSERGDNHHYYQYEDYFTSQVGRKKSVTVK